MRAILKRNRLQFVLKFAKYQRNAKCFFRGHEAKKKSVSDYAIGDCLQTTYK